MEEQGEIRFEETITNPLVRKRFIEKVIKKIGKPKEIESVHYVEIPEEMEALEKKYQWPSPKETKTRMRSTHTEEITSLAELGKKKLSFIIYIFPAAFEEGMYKIEDDFISGILHEYRHIRALNKGKIKITDGAIKFSSFLNKERKWNQHLLWDILELDAIKQQVWNDKISKEYLLNRCGAYFENYIKIWEHQEKMDPDFVRNLKIEFFQVWLFEVLAMKEGLYYLKSPQIEKEYWFSKEETLYLNLLKEKTTPIMEKIVKEKGQK